MSSITSLEDVHNLSGQIGEVYKSVEEQWKNNVKYSGIHQTKLTPIYEPYTPATKAARDTFEHLTSKPVKTFFQHVMAVETGIFKLGVSILVKREILAALTKECENYDAMISHQLPDEIQVSPDTARRIIEEYVAVEKAKLELSKAHSPRVKLGSLGGAVLGGASSAANGDIPGAIRSGSVAASNIKDLTHYDTKLAEVLEKADYDIFHVLGAYQLTKSPEGFVLKRGKWETHEGAMYTGTVERYFGVRMGKVGVDPKLTPELPNRSNNEEIAR